MGQNYKFYGIWKQFDLVSLASAVIVLFYIVTMRNLNFSYKLSTFFILFTFSHKDFGHKHHKIHKIKHLIGEFWKGWQKGKNTEWKHIAEFTLHSAYFSLSFNAYFFLSFLLHFLLLLESITYQSLSAIF